VKRAAPRGARPALALRSLQSADHPVERIRVSLRRRHRPAPARHGSVATVDDTLGALHLVVLAALLTGADDGLDVDDVAVLLADLEEAG